MAGETRSSIYSYGYLTIFASFVANNTTFLPHEANLGTFSSGLRLFGKYNQAVNEADGTEAKKHAIALAYFPTDNSGSLDVGLLLQTMSTSGGDGVIGLVGYILKFV